MTVFNVDCREGMAWFPDNTFDSIVCDPPYELGFMGKSWDSTGIAYDPVMWAEALRVLKPGGHLLAFSSARTYHRMVCAIEDAGFEIRDQIMWIYGSGFPKSLDVAKAIDKARVEDVEPVRVICRAVRAAMDRLNLKSKDLTAYFGDCNPRLIDHWAARDTDSQPSLPTWAQWLTLRGLLDIGGAYDAEVYRLNERKGQAGDAWQTAEVIGERTTGLGTGGGTVAYIGDSDNRELKAPATEAAQQWQGWGTALKPAFEPLCVAVKPITNLTELDIINANLTILEARLWSLLFASVAGTSSTSNPNELAAALSIARWSAADAINTRVDLCAQMGTSQFELVTNMNLNTVSSWRTILAEVSQLGNTSITGTKLSTTTDWKTLRFCLSQITPKSITLGRTQASGSTAFVGTAERYFDAELKRLQGTLELSVLAPAISNAQQQRQGATEPVKHEPICVARKPLIGTVAANVLQFGTGAINIDGCRVEGQKRHPGNYVDNGAIWGNAERSNRAEFDASLGRWPANVIHDGSGEVLAGFPQSVSRAGMRGDQQRHDVSSPETANVKRGTNGERGHNDAGSAARFFYCAKASRKDRNEGLDDPGPQFKHGVTLREIENTATRGNNHPTVKPTDLMRYLCRLVTPPGGCILDPFAGSGSTGKAAALEGFTFIGFELDAQYTEIANARIKAAA